MTKKRSKTMTRSPIETPRKPRERNDSRTGSVQRNPGERFTLAETRHHIDFVEQRLIDGNREAEIAAACRDHFDFGRARVGELLARVRERWAQEDAEQRPGWRSAQIRRLHAYIAIARGVRAPDGTWSERPNHAAVRSFEALIADLQGTREPVLHGIAWEHVVRAPTFVGAWPLIAEFSEGVDFIAAHNASFDAGVLRACCARSGLGAPTYRFECTVQIARRSFGIYPTKLDMVAERLGLTLDHHNAASDAEVCAQIVILASQAKARQPALSALGFARS